MLNGSKISSDGSYSLPKGTDRTWFEKENKKKQSTKEVYSSLDKDISDLTHMTLNQIREIGKMELQLQGLQRWLELA